MWTCPPSRRRQPLPSTAALAVDRWARRLAQRSRPLCQSRSGRDRQRESRHILPTPASRIFLGGRNGSGIPFSLLTVPPIAGSGWLGRVPGETLLWVCRGRLTLRRVGGCSMWNNPEEGWLFCTRIAEFPIRVAGVVVAGREILIHGVAASFTGHDTFLGLAAKLRQPHSRVSRSISS